MTRQLSSTELLRQVQATADRAPRVLPTSWWDEDVAVRMSAWLDHNVPDAERAAFIYGRAA